MQSMENDRAWVWTASQPVSLLEDVDSGTVRMDLEPEHHLAEILRLCFSGRKCQLGQYLSCLAYLAQTFVHQLQQMHHKKEEADRRDWRGSGEGGGRV